MRYELGGAIYKEQNRRECVFFVFNKSRRETCRKSRILIQPEHPMKKTLAFLALMVTLGHYAQNYTICPGQIATITASNPSNLTNPSYSLNPGGITSANGAFTVSPGSTTTYTVYVTGQMGSFMTTTSNQLTVSVEPAPTLSLQPASGYTLGCSSKSSLLVNLYGTPISTCGGVVTFTFPGFWTVAQWPT
jgi:hypothetical protein